MEDEILGTKQTLWALLNKYAKIEIPIIQRDYAQGRASASAIRKGILDHILGAVEEKKQEELDFIYGIRQPQDEIDDAKAAFIPIDGQQRLTTLWLLHWYLAHKSGLMTDAKIANKLSKFTYETRPSSKTFIDCLCKESISTTLPIRKAIIDDAAWFDESWKLDSSIMGAIQMLEDIENHHVIRQNASRELLNRLKENEYISFYFLPLHKFGLGEEIYSRMNARGKILTDFEKFKSTLFKIIDKSQHRKEFADKIEYEWVKNLWKYRPKGSYVTDKPFMRWLRYVTQMLYVETYGNPNEDKVEDMASPEILAEIYSTDANLSFLIYTLDHLPELESADVNFSLEWNFDKGLGKSIRWIMEEYNISNTDVMKQLAVWSALLFLKEKKEDKSGLSDFLRVVRNLIENTNDKSLREWPVLIQSIRELISDNVYEVLRRPELKLRGFRSDQRVIEIFKARMIGHNIGCKVLLQSMDDHPALLGRLTNIIIECQEPKATDKFTIQLSDISPKAVDIQKLGKMFKAYCELYSFGKTTDFNGIWGDLLDTRIYKNNENFCWYNDGGDDNYSDFGIHPSILKLAREIVANNNDVLGTILKREKAFVKKMAHKYAGRLEDVNKPKEQLYLLYIISARLLNCPWGEFFKAERYNFSWVPVQAGFSTPFNAIGDMKNQIYQAYNKYLRDNEVKNVRTPSVMYAHSRGKNVFERLIAWAEAN